MNTFENKKLKLSLEGFGSFNFYLAKVLDYELQIDQVFSGFLQYHYDHIKLKVVLKMAALVSKKKKEGVIPLNYAEVKTLTILFKLIPCTGYELVIQNQILDGLTLE